MQALRHLYEGLIILYSLAVEGEMAFAHYHRWLTNDGARFGAGTGKLTVADPDTKYQMPYDLLVNNFAEDGPHRGLHRRNIVVVANGVWEEVYREAIAEECCLVNDKGKADRNKVKSDVFKELNWYRQAIIHGSGTLDKNPKIICFFKKGEIVSLTKDHMHELFSILIDELNRLGETYYGKNPQFSLPRLLNQPS